MNYEELKREMNTQKVEMTAREREKEYKLGREVDFLPYKLQASDAAIGEIYGYTTSDMSDSAVMCDVIRRRKFDFGLEGLTVGLGLRSFGCAMGSVQETPKHGHGYIVKHCLEKIEDVKYLELPDPYTNRKLYGAIEKAKKMRELFPDYSMKVSLAGPITTAVSIYPIEKMLRDTRKHPEELKLLLDFIVDGTLEWLKAFRKEMGVMPVSFSDPLTCLDVLGKGIYMEFSHPYISKLTDGIYEIMGVYPDAHICGKTEGIWEELADAHIASLSLDDREDLLKAKETIGRRMSLSGNVPPVNIMKNGTIDEVISSVRTCIERGADNPCGYTVNTGCQLPLGTPRQNVDAYIYAVRKFGKNAKLGQKPKGIAEC